MIGQIARRGRWLAVMGAAGLAGCATFSDDGGMGAVTERVSADIGVAVGRIDTPAAADLADQRARALLAKPLTVDSAVQVALLRNRGLQAAFGQLGVAEADYVAATLPPNPTVSLSLLSGGGEVEVGLSLVAGLLEIATLPARSQIAADQFRAAQLVAAETTLRLVADTRRQYFRAVAAEERAALLTDVRDSANTSSELARRLGETGALNRIDQAREHALTGEIDAQLARARLQQRVEREKLTRLLGLWGNEIAYRLPARLPTLPAKVATLSTVESQAVQRRVDLEIARIELDAMARSLGLADATRLLADAELTGVAVRTKTDSGTVRAAGADLDLQVPLFDFGKTRVRKAEERYRQAADVLADKAVIARSEAREAYQTYRGSYDIAMLYERQILPLRRIIEEESLLHYNGMLVDVTALVGDVRARILSNVEAIDARRDFFIAETDLKAAITGGGMAGSVGDGAMPAASGGEGGGGH